VTWSWSRALYLEFFFDQTMENFLRGHVNGFDSFKGSARIVLYDNLKSAVVERHGRQIHFKPSLLELAAHDHFESRPCQVRAGNQKGRVERAIRNVRDSFWAARTFTTLEVCNLQALKWPARRGGINGNGRTTEAVGRELTLAASGAEFRILDGAREIARHRRSYNRQQLVLDPAH
jgi:transposase